MYKAAVRTLVPSVQESPLPFFPRITPTSYLPSVSLKTCEYYNNMQFLSTFAGLCLSLAIDVAFSGSVLFNSNAIKNMPGVVSSTHAVSASPDELTVDSGTQNLALDTPQVSTYRCLVSARCGQLFFIHCRQKWYLL